ncbi:hypothetical protein KM043_013947 [Ampulex compressa]|nr:hypothetical protein KM043_013947 [Ampulex compressa]
MISVRFFLAFGILAVFDCASAVASRKISRIPLRFRYVGDLDAAATGHGESKYLASCWRKAKEPGHPGDEMCATRRSYRPPAIGASNWLGSVSEFAGYLNLCLRSIGTGEDKHREEGGGTKHEEDHRESEGERADKGYRAFDEFDKGEKGHRDEEDHRQSYKEEDGEKKKKHEEVGHYGEQHHGVEGDKRAKFGEEGKHQKGHSTKGEHSVFKKDEYEKKHDFYDEYHEDGEHEKHGGYHHEHEGKKGGHEKKGHLDSGHHQHHHGAEKKYEDGRHEHEESGHKSAKGQENHHRHEEKYGKKNGQESGKRWSKKNRR